MKGTSRNKAFLLLFIPLLFSTISTLLVYSGHFSNYYANYENLLQTTFPDYAIVIENDLMLLDSDFNTSSFLKEFELNAVSYVGKLRCNVSINSNNYEIVLYWAPEEFFFQHTNVIGEKDKILLDESFISLEGLEINQIISLNFSSGSNIVETSLPVSNFVSERDVFTGELLHYSWAEPFHEENLFLVSETFYEIFEEFIESLTIYYVTLFEFSDAFLKSRPPHQMIEYLGKKRQELDYYFGYSYDPTNSEEEYIREYVLERKIQILTATYGVFNLDILARVMFFYVISFSFCYIVINNTTQSFIRTQKERIRISYLRGSRRSNLLLNFTNLELRATVISIFFSFLASIVVLGVFTPSLLGFAYYYGMNLLIICLITVFYGSIQLLILSIHLSQLYKTGEKEEDIPFSKLSTFLGKTLPWLLFNLSLGFSFFLLFFTGIEKFEFESMNSLIVISVLFTLFLNIIMFKRTILWIGKQVVSLSYIFSKLSKQTSKLSRRFIKDSYRVIQLLIFFMIISTFFLTSFDTINNFNSLNNEYPIITDYYWVPSVFRQFMFSLFTVYVVCLFFLFLAFYSETIDKQMKGFRIFFARGLSFKKGISLAMLPLFLFTLFYILFSYVVGLILSYVMFFAIQPEFSLRIPFTVFPFSFTFLSAQIILLGAILITSGITSYLKLRKQIPEVKFNVPSVFPEEEGII